MNNTVSRKNTRKIRPLPIICLVLAILLLIFLYLSQKKPKLLLTDNTDFEIGASVRLSDLISGVSYGKNLTEDFTIDSSRTGESKIAVEVENPFGKRFTEEITITFSDSDTPVITAPDSFSTDAGVPIDLLAEASASDNSGESISVSVEGDYDFAKAGKYSLFFVAADSSGNQAKKSFVLEVCASPFSTSPLANGKDEPVLLDGNYKTAKGFDLVVKDGIAYADGIMIVNKTYPLPRSYDPGKILPDAQSAYLEMADAAQKAGFSIPNVSGYRSFDFQETVFANYSAWDSYEAALTYSAKAGHSEHQSGYSMDLVLADSNRVAQNRPVLDWLSENAAKYGFILRYPEGKENYTGYKYEAWHFRFVGKEYAPKFYQNGDWIALEEYFGLESIYRN